jgi:hypothetical protein
MKAVKYLAGAAAAAALTVAAASPAQAQYWDPYRSNRGGIDVGDIVTGVAVLGGIQAILGAFSRDGGRYGYGNQYRYRDDYQNAVNSCGYQAQRYGQGGQVSVTDIDRRGANSYRVRGVINAGYGSYGGYGGNDRYDRYDRNDGRYGGYDQRVAFACTARSNGRVTDFDIDRRY